MKLNVQLNAGVVESVFLEFFELSHDKEYRGDLEEIVRFADEYHNYAKSHAQVLPNVLKSLREIQASL